MSESTDTIDRRTVRQTIRRAIQEHAGDPPREELVVVVADSVGVPEAAVADELDALERDGFVYCVGDQERVKLP